jgi:2-keto-4-pentenoate hydratase/2-oxohepta-3-ene-1,7-dioic acid hydratase in catechol pathway
VKTVQIKGSAEQIPVGKIVCIGQNYAEHIKEMKAETPKTPVFFLKPPTAIIKNGEAIELPSVSNDVHHEVELTILIGKDGKNIAQGSAMSHVAGFGVGLDMTLRDVQAEAKRKGLPWTLAKGFDTSAPLSDFVPKDQVKDAKSLTLNLAVNGAMRQDSSTSDLIFSVDQLIAYISKFITLEKGDVIYTGTPKGVSQVRSGDNLEASLTDSTGKVLAFLSVHVR